MGEDSCGHYFQSVDDLWETETNNTPDGLNEWYRRTLNYWSSQPASIDGVLAGYEIVSSVDLEASLKFLKRIAALPFEKGGPCTFERALDCGAGVGRVTEGCLSRVFKKVDLLEPVPHLLQEAKNKLSPLPNVEYFFQKSLQDFTPENNIYDCIWLQWCVLYLTDDDLIAFLLRCSENLKSRGVICIKENVSSKLKDGFHLDREDNSLMRTDTHYRQLFKKAGLRVILDMRQPKFPPNLFPVWMYCLRK